MTHAHAHPCRPFGLHRLMAMKGRGGWGGPGFGGPPGFGGGPPFGPRRRRPRGDVRAAILLVLADEPLSGYGLMQEIESRSEGVWRPSPGSVYPTLAQLEDEGLIRAEDDDGRKRYALTDAGAAYLEERRDELGDPWAGLGDEVGEGRRDLRDQFGQIAAAAYQVGRAGDEKQVEQASKVLDDARRALYRILAGEQPH